MIRRADALTETHHDRTITATGTLTGSYRCRDGVTVVITMPADREVELGGKEGV